MTIRGRTRFILVSILPVAVMLVMRPGSARADVTVHQQTTMNLGGLNLEIDSVERTSADKQRTDTSMHCHGFLALFCRDAEGGQIVRLDKRLEWQLQPKKRLYTEHPFLTAAQRAQAQQELDAAMQKMKQCPMPQSPTAAQSAPDTKHCQLSPLVLNVTRTNDHATIAGHDTRKTNIVMSQTCTDQQTGDVCEIDYGFETWLTQDAIAGANQRTAFMRKYLAAQGLDPSNPRMQASVQRFMAPYADMLRQLHGKAADLQGYPLRTTFYMAFGGPHCSRAKQAQQQQASSSSKVSVRSIAAKAFAGGLAGFFHRGVAAIHTDSAAGAAAAGAANEAAEPTASAAAGSVAPQGSSGSSGTAAAPSGLMVRAVSFTVETTSIDVASIPSDVFDIPTGWQLEPQKQLASRGSGPVCPTAGK